jgi:hypothetical protein
MFLKRYSGENRLVPTLLVVVSALLLAALLMPALSAGARGNDRAKVLEFETMAPVSGPFVGATNPIRTIGGGGLPWVIAAGSGELGANGALEVRVRGLVIDPASAAAQAAHLAGVNPLPAFAVFVSCLTNDDPKGVNPNTLIKAGTFPATPTGNMDAEAHITLPRPCVAPIVFVTSPGSPASWFAATGVGM